MVPNLSTNFHIFKHKVLLFFMQDTFYDMVQRVHNKQRPHLVLFYAHWSTHVLRYLNAFHSTSIALSEINSSIITSVIDIHEHHAGTVFSLHPCR